MRDDLRNQLYAELERVVSLDEARIHIQTLNFQVYNRLNFSVSPHMFWAELRQLLTNGAEVDGEFRLLRQIATQFPDNRALQQILWTEISERSAVSQAMPPQVPPGPPVPPHGGHGAPGYPPYGTPHMSSPPYQPPGPWQSQAYYVPPQPVPTAPPTTAAPGAGVPGTAAPGAGVPGTGAPGTAAPGTAAPDTAAPGTGAPGTAAPDTAASGNNHTPPPPNTVRPHPQDATAADGRPREEEPEPPAYHHTLVFIAASHHAQFMQVVQREDRSAQLLYVSNGEGSQVGQVAMLLSRPMTSERVERLRTALWVLGAPEDLEISRQVHGHRPFLFEQLRALGPDKQPYEFDNVPSTTTGHDIAAAVLGYGEGKLRDRLARRRRAVVDRVLPDGSFRRLADLTRTLYDSGVRDGDTLHVWPESTAGAPQERTRAIRRVRREIRQYAHQHQEVFRIEHMDDPDFPTLYVISFSAPGFRPPPKDAPPGSPPVPQNEHTVTIRLGPNFPYEAPLAVWQTPVFHPNILGPERPRGCPPEAPDGLVCLGPLQRAYRPTMDFGRLCQMLVDIAGFQTYDVRSQNEGGEGWFNARAAQWAASKKGEAMIKRIGGVPSAPAQENPDGDAASLRVRALRLRKANVVGDDT